ncbi:trans-Golgi network integral membrane protein 2-like isoform X2 [Haliotis cracherodii]|uniref:trans-Golgi network integral membrane protein 2-like isoform X2 n=1 Tax=Haliotis cracherodii TaxID=6455 RepID=UPI0039EB4E4B
MAATNRRDGVRIGLMLLLLTVSYIRAQDEPQDEEGDWFAEFLDLRNSCKFPMFSIGFLIEPSGKFYYEVCKTTQPDGDLSRLCQKMFDLTLYMCNQTQVSEQKKKTIDTQMSSELMKFAKDETPFCTRLERDRNSSNYLGTYLPKDMNCETACKKDVAEKLCEFNFFSVIVYENITAAAGQSGREPNRSSSSTGPIGVAGDISSAKTTGTNVGSPTPPLAIKSNNKTVTVENKEGDTNTGQEVNNTGSPLNGSHALVPVNGSAVEPKGTDVVTDRPVAVDKTNKTTVKVEGLSGKDPHETPATVDRDGLSGKDPHETPATVGSDGLSGKDPHETPATVGSDGLSGKDPHETPATVGSDGLTRKDPHETPATVGRDGLSGKDPHETPATVGRDGLSGKDPHETPATVGRDGLSGKDPHETPATVGRDGLSGKDPHETPATVGRDGLSGKDPHETPATVGRDGLSGKDPHETPATVGRDGLSGKENHKTLGVEGGDGLSGKENHKTLGVEGGDGLSGRENHKTLGVEGSDGLSGKENHKSLGVEGGDGQSGKENHKTLDLEGGDGLSGKGNHKTLDVEGGDGLSGKENHKSLGVEGGDGQSGKDSHETLSTEGGDGQSGKDSHDTDSDFSEPGDGRRQPVVHSDTAKSPVQIKKLEKEYEAPSSGNFMAYFLTAVVLCIAGYVVFHNKQKIIAFVIEGRSGQGRRRTNGSGEYKKLQSNVEESV